MKTDKLKENPGNFIRDFIVEDIAKNRIKEVVTRFPPEPNGYLHLGHAKSICLNFGIAADFNGRCHLRFDDTNPANEEIEFIDSIIEDVRWLGFEWGDNLHYASDYFETFYAWAEHLIETDNAYVDDLSADEIRKFRGTLTKPGQASPFRKRERKENLKLFRLMAKGEFGDGEKVLRAKIDMSSGNISMRDPVIYRILHAEHPRTGKTWCIYPTYDFAHGQSDAIEGVSHSLCTLEFEDHRPLYDWHIEKLPVPSVPRQYEFARLNMTYTVLSKRKLTLLVDEKHVGGWNDPRMPTIAGMRRRGVPAAAIRDFCARIGITKAASTVETSYLDYCIRESLNEIAIRRMGVLDPLKVVIENYPSGKIEKLLAKNHPKDETRGNREIPFTRELFIERSDFMENPSNNFFRLGIGREVRLRFAYFITCTEVIKDVDGNIIELRCIYDKDTKGGNASDGRKVKGTIHWVSVNESLTAEVRLFDHLFKNQEPELSGDEFLKEINPNSLKILENCKLEPSLSKIKLNETVQFERQGYFCLDIDSTENNLVFNRTVGLRDTWTNQKTND
ncbi:MAG: glutamine--tRNA ligase/YqeY domain fusion protein [Pseudomonadota bacterium]|nr:glutamine--tRNA ligase/YqeY domain fusion protein [Pseudomonadota bacterium]